MRNKTILFILIITLYGCGDPSENHRGLIPGHVSSIDFNIMDEAFMHGYTHNIVYETVELDTLPTLTIQCTSEETHRDGPDFQPELDFFSVWTRDLYWGFLGWAQAGDDRVLEMMKSSIQLLILAKERNQALGQSELWPLDNKRYYVPQAYTTGLKSALNLFPWCSESQADFLLLCHDYWELSGDIKFIRSIWNEIEYVTETLELLDTDGNSLPDAIQGSYDYMWIKEDSEEPLMCAKTSLAYQRVSSLAGELGKDAFSSHLSQLSEKVKETMNKTTEEGGLWKQDPGGGYYIQMRSVGETYDSIHDLFIPYNNLVPIWCDMTSRKQDHDIFTKLDASFDAIYNLDYGPMYCAPAGKNDESVMECSSVTWLAFLDIYLRGKKGHYNNRDRIYSLLMEHKGDAGGVPFPEGAGVYGYLTGGAGRSWDNGNFFHMLISGVYGIQKDRKGISLTNPNPLDSEPLTELHHVCWRDAVYDFSWQGAGSQIVKVSVNGKILKSANGKFILDAPHGHHAVVIELEPNSSPAPDSTFAILLISS